MAERQLIGDDTFSDDAIRDALRAKAKDYGTGGALLSVNDVMDVIEANPDVVLRALGMVSHFTTSDGYYHEAGDHEMPDGTESCLPDCREVWTRRAE